MVYIDEGGNWNQGLKPGKARQLGCWWWFKHGPFCSCHREWINSFEYHMEKINVLLPRFSVLRNYLNIVRLVQFYR